jgi:hypothetical protein
MRPAGPGRGGMSQGFQERAAPWNWEWRVRPASKARSVVRAHSGMTALTRSATFLGVSRAAGSRREWRGRIGKCPNPSRARHRAGAALGQGHSKPRLDHAPAGPFLARLPLIESARFKVLHMATLTMFLNASGRPV